MSPKRLIYIIGSGVFFSAVMQTHSQGAGPQDAQSENGLQQPLYFDQAKSIEITKEKMASLIELKGRQEHQSGLWDDAAVALAWYVVGLGEFATYTPEVDGLLNMIARDFDKEYVPFWIGGTDHIERILQGYSFPAGFIAFHESRSMADLARNSLEKIRKRSKEYENAAEENVNTAANAVFLKLQQRFLAAPSAGQRTPAQSMLWVNPDDKPLPSKIVMGKETVGFSESWVIDQLRAAMNTLAKEPIEPNQSFGFHLTRPNYSTIIYLRETLAWLCVALGEYSEGGPIVQEILHEVMSKLTNELVPEWIGDRTRRRLYLMSFMFESNENAIGSGVMNEAQSIFELAEQALEKIAARTGKPIPEYSGPYPRWRWRFRSLPE